MPINPSLQRKLDSMKQEVQKIRDTHKATQAAMSDKTASDIEILNAKRQQMLDAEKKRTANAQNQSEQFDATELVQAMINEAYASGGFDYEKDVNDKLKKYGKADPDSTTAGSSGDAPDAKFKHNGQEHNLEVKKDHKAMFGQIELKHDGKKWGISDRSRAKYPETAKSIEATGFLQKVNKQWDKPSGDYESDLQKGNVYHVHSDAEPIKAHYGKDRNTPYIQIGGGHGFYHTGEDRAKLGSPELEGKTQLRARMKARGRDADGKRTYGALIVMSLKDAQKSHHDLDAPVQKEWIEDVLNGHKEFMLESKLEEGYIVEETECFSHGFWSGQQEEPKKNPYEAGTKDYTEYENGYMQGVMTRRRMQVESHVEFRIDHRDKLTGDHKSTFAKHDAKVSDTTDKATYVKVPSHKADSFKSAMKGHGAKVELAEETIDEGLLGRLVAKGINALHKANQKRPLPKPQDRREYETPKTEEVAANNVGGGSIAGTQGDAGKKVKMMSEPLKRKPMPRFKTYVSQEHENN
jgi:hypothetical protein